MADTNPRAYVRSQIRGIQTVAKSGAHGDPTKVGLYVYGKRPDGRTVPCHCDVRQDGSVVVSSTWRSPECKPGEVTECASEFTASEWREIEGGHPVLMSFRCNQILDRRTQG